MGAGKKRPEAKDEAAIRGGDLAAFGPRLPRALSLHGELGNGGEDARSVEPAGGDRLSAFAAGAVSRGDAGLLAPGPARLAADPGDRDSGTRRAQAPANPPAHAGSRAAFCLACLLLGILFFAGLTRAGRGYAELTGEFVPAPIAFSRPAPHHLLVGVYDLQFNVDLERLGRKARSLAKVTGKSAASLLQRLRALARLGPAARSEQEISRSR